MQTLKDIAIEFANEAYQGYDGEFLNELKEGYINDIIEYNFNMDGSDNKAWEAGYIRGYEVALKGILHEIESSNNKLITADRINYLLTN